MSICYGYLLRYLKALSLPTPSEKIDIPDFTIGSQRILYIANRTTLHRYDRLPISGYCNSAVVLVVRHICCII